jgi:hypothetical protein
MPTDARPRTALLILAAVTSLLGLLISPLAGVGAAAVPAALTVVAILLVLRLDRQEAPADQQLLTKVSQQVETGRKLVIYERETGLFAHWYLVLRCEEECKRAGRYERPLTLLLVEPASETGAWDVNDAIVDWLRRQLRAADLPGYLGNARYVVVMPETTPAHAKRMSKRLLRDVAGSEVSLSRFPEDGDAYEELYEAARNKLAAARQAA